MFYQQQSELASRHVVVVSAAPALPRPRCMPQPWPTSRHTQTPSTLWTPLAAWKARMIAGLHLKRSCSSALRVSQPVDKQSKPGKQSHSVRGCLGRPCRPRPEKGTRSRWGRTAGRARLAAPFPSRSFRSGASRPMPCRRMRSAISSQQKPAHAQQQAI